MIRLGTLIVLALAVGALFVARVQLPLFAAHPVASAPAEVTLTVHQDNNSDDEDDSTLVGALAAAGYHPSVDELVALSNAGVDTDLIAAVGDSDIVRPSIDDLISLANSGVDASDLRDYARLDAGLTTRDIIALAHNGIGADDVDELRTAGYRPDSLEDIVELHNAGVDGDYVRALRRHGYHDLSADQIVRLHNAGVDV